MSLRDLVDGECGGANQLMRMGAQLTRDTAHKDEGYAGNANSVLNRPHPAGSGPDEFVNEFLAQTGRSAPPPQSFRMDALLKEMQNIHQQPTQSFEMWRNEFVSQQRDLFDGPGPSTSQPVAAPSTYYPTGPSTMDTTNWTREFFNESQVRPSITVTGSPINRPSVF